MCRCGWLTLRNCPCGITGPCAGITCEFPQQGGRASSSEKLICAGAAGADSIKWHWKLQRSASVGPDTPKNSSANPMARNICP